MKMNRTIFAVVLSIAFISNANASSTRVIDAAQINNAGSLITLPSTTATLCGKDESCTLTNKTLTSPVINTPTGIAKGDVGLGNVDNTSDASKNSATATLTNKTIDGASNTLTSIPATTALSGQVPVGNGGTGASALTSGSVVVGNGTSPVNLVAPGSNGNVLTSNGSTWVSTAPASVAPSISGTSAAPTAVTAAGGVSFSGTSYANIAFVEGSGGAVTITANPKIAAATNVGQRLTLIGGSGTNTITITDGNGVDLNGSIVLGLQSVIGLIWNGTVWVEEYRR